MMAPLLLLVGSPRKKGTSASFASTMKAFADQTGSGASIEFAVDYFDGRLDLKYLRRAVQSCQAMGLVTPMYVDTLPYPVIWTLEQLALAPEDLSGKGFFAVTQYGFPDIELSQPSLGVCRCFAEATGMKWLGGVGYGGGPLINGAALETLGKKGKRIASALQMIVQAAQDNEAIPTETQQIIAEKIPRILFWPLSVFMNRMAKKNARELGTDLKAKPYQE